MNVKLLIQGTVKVVMVAAVSTGLMVTTAEAQSLEGQDNDTQVPVEIPSIDRGISSTSGVQVIQPEVVTAPDTSGLEGKKLKEAIPSNDNSPVEQRAPLAGKGFKPTPAEPPVNQRTATPMKPKAALPQAEPPINQRTATPMKPKAALPQAEPPINQRTATPMKPNAPAPQAEPPINQRTATPMKPNTAAPEVESPINQRTATPMKPNTAAPEAEPPINQRTATPMKPNTAAPEAEPPINQRTATPMKPNTAAPEAEPPINQRTATPMKPNTAAPEAEPPINQRTATPMKPNTAAREAEPPVNQRTATPMKPHHATVVDDPAELPINARTAHAGKGGKVTAMRAQRVNHHTSSFDPLSCRARQEPGSVAGLQALSQHLPEYDIEEKDYDNLPKTSEPTRTTTYHGNSKFIKNLERTVLDAIRKPRVRRGQLIKDPTRAKGWCLQGVHEAIQRASGKPVHPWTRSAKNAGPFLVREQGYKKSRPGQYTAYNAPVGSVLIYDDPRNPGAHGHIEIKMSNGYYSDFYEKYPINDPRQMGAKRRLIGIYVPPEN